MMPVVCASSNAQPSPEGLTSPESIAMPSGYIPNSMSELWSDMYPLNDSYLFDRDFEYMFPPVQASVDSQWLLDSSCDEISLPSSCLSSPFDSSTYSYLCATVNQGVPRSNSHTPSVNSPATTASTSAILDALWSNSVPAYTPHPTTPTARTPVSHLTIPPTNQMTKGITPNTKHELLTMPTVRSETGGLTTAITPKTPDSYNSMNYYYRTLKSPLATSNPADELSVPAIKSSQTITKTASTNSQRKSSSTNTRSSNSCKGFRIPAKSRSILQDYFNKQPYPSSEMLDELAMTLSLQLATIKNWFGNCRARRPKGQTTSSLAVRGTQLSQIKDVTDVVSTTERFLATPCEEDPRALNILKMVRGSAAAKLSNISTISRFKYRYSPYNTSKLARPHAKEKGDSETENEKGNIQCVISNGRTSRRGRRRHMQTTPAGYILESKKVVVYVKKFYCTFCGRAFSNKYEWNRHEESVHVPQKLWICCPSELVGDGQGLARCPFCSVVRPTLQHLATHGFQECASKDQEQRTFTRRDHLIQHIQQSHRKECAHREELLREIRMTFDSWAFPISPAQLGEKNFWCGFCGKRTNTWSERVLHIADHYRRGTDLTEWWLRRADCTTEEVPNIYGGESFKNESVEEYDDGNTVKQCKTCGKTWPNIHMAKQEHRTCEFFTCSLIRGVRSTFNDTIANNFCRCYYCGKDFEKSNEWESRLLHVNMVHGYRDCEQKRFYSRQEFINHLITDHAASIFSRTMYENGNETWSSGATIDSNPEPFYNGTHVNASPNTHATFENINFNSTQLENDHSSFVDSFILECRQIVVSRFDSNLNHKDLLI